MAKYDLAISFAGEDRPLARGLADRLDAAGYSIFFDEFHQAELWGRDLSVALSEVYARDARWCLILVSEAYLQKPWTNIERQNALSRFMKERGGYLLCLRFDSAKLPGLPDVVGYIDYSGRTEEEVYGLLLQRMGRPSHDDFISLVSESDRDLAGQLIRACYRRAVFTRMDSEIDVPAMYDSINEAIGSVQQIISLIRDPNLQFVASKILRALDAIERLRPKARRFLEPRVRREIDDEKQNVIRHLLEIRRAAALSIQMPLALRTDHFFGPEAREPPSVDF